MREKSVEIWKDVLGSNGKYQVSFDGRVKRIYKNGKSKILSPFIKQRMRGSKRLVVKLTISGISKEVMVHQLVAECFIGKCPTGKIPYHKNGIVTDNYASNIEYRSKVQVGKETGGKSRRIPVAKINEHGEIEDVYSSARECARQNYCSRQTVSDHCNGKVKKPIGNMTFAWEDDDKSMNQAIRRIEIAFGSAFAKAAKIEMEW